MFDAAQTFLQDQALAPEDLAVAPDGKRAFAGLRDGRVVFFTTKGTGASQTVEMHDFARTGFYVDTCGDEKSEFMCGRPLGLHFVKGAPFARYVQKIEDATFFPDSKMLLVVDAYRGVLLLDAMGKSTTVFDAIGLRRFKFLNAVAVTEDGQVYVTESSRRFTHVNVTLDTLERQPTGRLLHFDPTTLRVSVVAKGLGFPNGLALVDNEQALLIAMTFQNKLVKFNLQTKTMEDFAFLPGMPDNLWIEKKKERTDKLYVGLVSLQPWWFEYVLTPKIRKVMAHVVPAEWVRNFVSPHGAFVKVDVATGTITHVYQDRDGSTRFLSGVHAFGNHYYLLSGKRDNLVRISKRAFT